MAEEIISNKRYNTNIERRDEIRHYIWSNLTRYKLDDAISVISHAPIPEYDDNYFYMKDTVDWLLMGRNNDEDGLRDKIVGNLSGASHTIRDIERSILRKDKQKLRVYILNLLSMLCLTLKLVDIELYYATHICLTEIDKLISGGEKDG